MAQDSQAQSKPKWGVGSFFQQAVAGVESRLDNILLDEEERQKNATANAKPESEAKVETKNTPLTRSPAGCMGIHSNCRRTWLISISSDLAKFIECAEERPTPGAPGACYGQIEYGKSQFTIFPESLITSR